MSTDPAPQCEEEVMEPPGYWHSHQCTRRARFQTVDLNGDPHRTCAQHAKFYRQRGRSVTDLVSEPSQ